MYVLLRNSVKQESLFWACDALVVLKSEYAAEGIRSVPGTVGPQAGSNPARRIASSPSDTVRWWTNFDGVVEPGQSRQRIVSLNGKNDGNQKTIGLESVDLADRRFVYDRHRGLGCHWTA